MFENIKKINFKGGFFDTDTEFQLFYEAPIGIVYGRNGSGKTTIAKCFRELAKKADEEKSAEYTVSTNPVIAEASKPQIFVFDEDFVREKVRVEDSDELAAIVMLGEQGEIDDQIKEKNNELKLVNEKLAVLDGLKNEYADQNNAKSTAYHFNAIKKELQRDGGWADIDRDVKEHATKTGVNVKTIEAFLKIEEPTESAEELKKQLDLDYDVYMHSDSSSKVDWKDCTITCPDSLSEIETLLREPLEKPDLSDREKRLFAFLSEHAQGETKKLLDEEWAFCPTCLREVQDEDRMGIAKTLEKLLNEKAEDYKSRLAVKLALFEPIKAELPAFPNNLHQTEINAVLAVLGLLNNMLAFVNSKLMERQNRLYEVIEKPFDESFVLKYAQAVADFKTKLEALKQLVTKYNQLVADLNALYNKVLKENNRLARKQYATMFAMYQQAGIDTQKNLDDWKAADDKRQALEKEIADLKTRKKNTEIALGYINLELQYVFFSNQKVKLVSGDDGNYKLKVNNKLVKPHKISVGERNVLGLCYFFASLFNGKEKEKKYEDESLIIIDDPVSSFDHGNRVGVMSLLRYQFSSILKGNPNSRILVMSHDLHSIFDLIKIRKELCEDISGKVKEECKGYLELEKKQLARKTTDNEYKKLLIHVFDYACLPANEDTDENTEMSIGNMMRRLLEAYASFCYNETFEKMVRRESVLEAIDESKRTYYENFMYRLALNGESHEAEQVYTLDDMTPFFTKEEKLQTAKSLLLFLYYINKPHLEAYFGKEANDKFATILGWQADEATWITQEQ